MTDYYYYSNFNTFLIVFVVVLLISSAIGIYRNAAWKAHLERQNQRQVRVVYFRAGPGPSSVHPYPMGPPPPLPPYSEVFNPTAPPPPTSHGKPPPYAAVA